jgi:signal transduction histidine kinase
VICSFLDAFHLNHLQRKIVLVVVLIILIPMVVTSAFSASWIATRMDASIHRWITEAAEVDRNWLATVNQNGRLFADVLNEVTHGQPRFAAGRSPIPSRLQPMARQMGITLVQVFDPGGRQIYSSPKATLDTSWTKGQSEAVLKVSTGDKTMLAAVNVLRYPRNQARHYRVVLGTLFDKELLGRLDHLSGLKTRLFYPRDGDFAKAFSEEGRPLKLRLPPAAFEQLKRQQPYYSDSAENGRYWGLYTPVADSNGRVEAVLFSGLAHHRGDTLITDQTFLIVLIIILGGVLAGVTGLLLSRLIARPVEVLRDGVMRVASQDFRATLPVSWRDELGDLARAFNGMADSLREARDEQRREFQRDKIAALGELSLAMAHEIRTPIGVINTAAKLLDSAGVRGDREELQQVIRTESVRLDQLLKDFQQLARHRKPEFSRIDPREPLERALQLMLAGHDDIRVQRRYTHDDLRISADAELVQQAWANLVRNAIEAMGDKGELLVGSAVEDEELVLYLQDSGPGIPPELMTRLFEPFYTTKSHGSGLGLTIATTLVEASGGRLELVPETRSGARFAMRFAIVEAHQ